VYDHDAVGADDVIGFTVIMVNDLIRGMPKDMRIPLLYKVPKDKKKKDGKKKPGTPKDMGKPAGTLHIELTAVDFGMMPGYGAPAPGGYAPPPPVMPGGPPPGWLEQRDATGKPYYVNTATGQTM
jgi:hypothetical protein